MHANETRACQNQKCEAEVPAVTCWGSQPPAEAGARVSGEDLSIAPARCGVRESPQCSRSDRGFPHGGDTVPVLQSPHFLLPPQDAAVTPPAAPRAAARGARRPPTPASPPPPPRVPAAAPRTGAQEPDLVPEPSGSDQVLQPRLPSAGVPGASSEGTLGGSRGPADWPGCRAGAATPAETRDAPLVLRAPRAETPHKRGGGGRHGAVSPGTLPQPGDDEAFLRVESR